MSISDLTELRAIVAPAVEDYDATASVTVSFQTNNEHGETFTLPSVRGLMTAVALTIPLYDDLSEVAKDAVNRVKALQTAGLFADVSDKGEFPGIARDEITLSIHVAV